MNKPIPSNAILQQSDQRAELFLERLQKVHHHEKWLELEHQIFRDLKNNGFNKVNWVLAVSGGLDSMAMLFLLLRISSAFEVKLSVLHIHHGQVAPDSRVSEAESTLSHFRDSALFFVERLCQRLNVPFEFTISKSFLKNEEECRDFRLQTVKPLMESQRYHHCLMAHHRDDFVETQFIRLIRGGGRHSISQPMKKFSERSIRPFLDISRKEIVEYQKHFQFPFLEDPSNQNPDYLRNWLRNFWLPQLEERSPGALDSISRSLVLLSESHSVEWQDELFIYNEKQEGLLGQKAQRLVGFKRFEYDCLSFQQRRELIVRVFQILKIKNFSLNHVLEVIKYLDKTDRVHSFKVASLMWTVDSQIVQFSP